MKHSDWKCHGYIIKHSNSFFQQPVPPADLEDAQKYMRCYVEICMKVFGPQWATGKNHWCLHIMDDCKNHQCHLERLSTYKFENRYGDFKHYIRQGHRTLEQIRLVLSKIII